ncbi:ABC-three component system protein [Rhizobium ruizarguesonis]|uniref:ABC-three component system protein n=1 Tax=Rhizobium sp. WSM1274 TaxID=3138254 RepID=UPI0021A428A3|nr:ABC-three component system protein [Rhizobium leguminosarum]UWU31662.1 hypothetical protein N2600_26075 [Rhizobium leguminosarum bv. viciae]
MSEASNFSAADSFIGYVYQCEYALYRALDPDDHAQGVMIETLDDVTAEGLDALELIQLKHHDQKKLKSLTDKSEDVWKTVRAWSMAIQKGAVDAANAKFFLLTTAPSSTSSMLAEHLLAPGEGSKRNVTEAYNLMVAIAEEMAASNVEDNRKRAGPFLALDEVHRKALVSNITIVSNMPVIEELRKKILKRLSFSGATAENLEEFTEAIAGWWYTALIQRLRTPGREMISKEALQEKISSLVVQYAAMTLPMFEDIGKPGDDDVNVLRRRLFVKQLAAIGHTGGMVAVSSAMTDYYKADGHIKRWVQNLQVEPKDLATFEEELTGHWATNFATAEAEAQFLTDDPDSEKKHQGLGRTALKETLQGSQAKLKGLSLDYLRRGVFHMMANKPSIGWHPQWSSIFKGEN